MIVRVRTCVRPRQNSDMSIQVWPPYNSAASTSEASLKQCHVNTSADSL